MNDYSYFPPIKYFEITLRSCPQTALLYATLWRLKKNKKRISIKRNDINKKFLISPTLFRNHMISLSRLDILSLVQTTNENSPDIFLIEFHHDEN